MGDELVVKSGAQSSAPPRAGAGSSAPPRARAVSRKALPLEAHQERVRRRRPVANPALRHRDRFTSRARRARQSTRCVIVEPLGGRAWVIEQGKRAPFLRYVDHGEGDAVWRGAWPRDAKLLVTRGQGRGLRPRFS